MCDPQENIWYGLEKSFAKMYCQSLIFYTWKSFIPTVKTDLAIAGYSISFNPVQMLHCRRLVGQFSPLFIARKMLAEYYVFYSICL